MEDGSGPHERRDLEFLLRTIGEMCAVDHPRSLLRSLLDHALGVADAERGFLLLLDRSGELRVTVARDRDGKDLPLDLPRSRSVPEEVARTGRVLALPGDEARDVRDSITWNKITSVLCGPLRIRGRTLGVLYLDSRVSVTRLPGPRDRVLFGALCHELAIALDLARLAQKEQSLEIARSVQERLLPAGDLRVPGLMVHGIAHPWEEVGGDLFDYLRLPGGRVGLILGDVVGHGIGAALQMATCRSVLRTTVALEPDLARAITRANRALAEELSAQEFLSMFLAEIDVGRREIRYVRAGHPSPILLRRETGECVTFDDRAPPLGVLAEREYALSEPTAVEPGDLLVLYTDGLEEARRDGAFLGEEGILEALRELRDRPVREIGEGLVERARVFAGEAGIDDDVTVVVARFGERVPRA